MLEGNSEPSTAGAAAVLHCQKKHRKYHWAVKKNFKKTLPHRTGLTDREKVKMELEKYLLQPECDSETDPLQWWQIHEQNFKRVSLGERGPSEVLCDGTD